MRAKMLLYRDSTNFTPVWCTVFDGLESLARSVRNTIFFRRRHFAARKAKSGQREVKIHEQHENSELKRRAPKSKVTLTGLTTRQTFLSDCGKLDGVCSSSTDLKIITIFRYMKRSAIFFSNTCGAIVKKKKKRKEKKTVGSTNED